jgi:aspartate aminotransferase
MLKGITKRALSISPSPTLALDAKIKKMRSEGIPVISFGVGEPDFDTPENIKTAAKKAIDDGFTKYTPAQGTESLRKTICDFYQKKCGIELMPNNIVVSNGAKHSLFNIAMALFEEGDEVIIPAPYWVSYPEQVILMGAKPVIINTGLKEKFKITSEQLKNAITTKTKAVILNSPSNPTGMVYSKEELEELLKVILEKDIYLIADEIYDALVYDNDNYVSVLEIAKHNKTLLEKIIVVNGVSKTYAMTGWRIGYTISDSRIAKFISDMQSQSTSNPCSISQKAAEEALSGSQDSVKLMLKEFTKRRDLISSLLDEIKEVNYIKPQGSFYIFPNFTAYTGKSFNGIHVQSTLKLCEYLLEEAKIGAVPGEAFGAPGYIRFSFATSEENIIEGMHRLKDALEKLK